MFSVVCGIKPPLNEKELKIVGGNVVTPYSWPWQVALKYYDGEIRCGGTLLDQNWVLTAASCQFNGQVVLGEHNLYTLEGSEQVCDNHSWHN
jgi:chymotrypsin